MSFPDADGSRAYIAWPTCGLDPSGNRYTDRMVNARAPHSSVLALQILEMISWTRALGLGRGKHLTGCSMALQAKTPTRWIESWKVELVGFHGSTTERFARTAFIRAMFHSYLISRKRELLCERGRYNPFFRISQGLGLHYLISYIAWHRQVSRQLPYFFRVLVADARTAYQT